MGRLKMSKYNHNVRLLSYNLFGIDDEKRRYFAYELIYHLVKKVSSEDLDRAIDAALEQTDVNIYNKYNGEVI